MFSGLLEGATKFFGVTSNPYEGGYITKSGELLDFSGRHLKIGFRNHNIFNISNNKNINIISIEHGIFYGINHDGYCLTKEFPQLMREKNCVASFMFYTGCIRLKIAYSSKKDGYIDFVRPPSQKQIEKLSQIFSERGAYITQTSIDGDVLLDEHITCLDKNKLCEVIRKRSPLITPSIF